MREFIDVDPAELYVPPEMLQGADPGKFARQFSKYGKDIDGMPPIEITRGYDGHYRINDGVTRAVRAAKFRPGVLIPAEVIEDCPTLKVTRCPKIKDLLP
ncbi:hypothetical protein BH11PLA2_BH11PLA2_22030 [soil metagenome]